MTYFFGRKPELAELESQIRQPRASFIVVTGRRRIGKSRLIEEFAKPYRLIKFSGLAPSPVSLSSEKKISAPEQRAEFARRLANFFSLPPLKQDDWGDLFDALSMQVQISTQEKLPNQKIVILFDEISWMGMDDPTFLSKLKDLWDDGLKKNPNLMFVLCGSVSSWIEENILSSTGFLGRVHRVLHLQELSLLECQGFFKLKNHGAGAEVSALEKLQILAVTGGVPLYLESMDFSKSALQNIQSLCFTPGALLVREFDQIFSDLFSKRNLIYKNIVQALSAGPLEPKMLCEKLGQALSGQMTQYFQDLVQAGFLERDYTWAIKTGTLGRLSRYRLSDNYLRFYLKYIEPKLTQIQQKTAVLTNISQLHQWPVILGLQFENLILHNRHLIFEKLGISPEEVEVVGPYFQSRTAKQKGCQFDLLIQTKHQTLWACEIKFSKNLLNQNVADDMAEKIKALSLPRGFSMRPVLIHVSGVSENLESSGYFSRILDFSEFLGA